MSSKNSTKKKKAKTSAGKRKQRESISAGLDASSASDGDNIWLIRLPANVDLEALDGTTIDQPFTAVNSSDGTETRYAFQATPEASAMTAMVQEQAEADDEVALQPHPIARHLRVVIDETPRNLHKDVVPPKVAMHPAYPTIPQRSGLKRRWMPLGSAVPRDLPIPKDPPVRRKDPPVRRKDPPAQQKDPPSQAVKSIPHPVSGKKKDSGTAQPEESTPTIKKEEAPSGAETKADHHRNGKNGKSPNKRKLVKEEDSDDAKAVATKQEAKRLKKESKKKKKESKEKKKESKKKKKIKSED